jgi:lysozyme
LSGGRSAPLVSSSGRASAESLAIAIITSFEGFFPVAYWDVNRWSIGYGTASKEGDTISKEDALTAALEHIRPIIKYIQHKVPDAAIHEIAALTSFAYNVGLGAFKRSSVWRHFRNGEKEKAADSLGNWVKAEGKVVLGLEIRRFIEGEILVGTVHLLNEKRIQRWVERRNSNKVSELDLTERIKHIRHSEKRYQELMEELKSERREVQKKD